MKKPPFSLNQPGDLLAELVAQSDQRALAVWAGECAERVLPHFEERFPHDPRPRQALITLQAWIDSGVFKMSTIRGASLAAHAAAREVGEDTAARSAARAAGQAVATAHVPAHALAAARYAQQAVHRAADAADAVTAVAGEWDWQYRRLSAGLNPPLVSETG